MSELYFHIYYCYYHCFENEDSFDLIREYFNIQFIPKFLFLFHFNYYLDSFSSFKITMITIIIIVAAIKLFKTINTTNTIAITHAVSIISILTFRPFTCSIEFYFNLIGC